MSNSSNKWLRRRTSNFLVIFTLLLLIINVQVDQQVAASDPWSWILQKIGVETAPTSPSPPLLISNSSIDLELRNGDLEREASGLSGQYLRSPAQIIRNYRNGRYLGTLNTDTSTLINNNDLLMTAAALREQDVFKCVDPNVGLYRQFVRQYDRRFADNIDRDERLQLFFLTLKRAIMFNRIIQNEISNETNYQIKPEIGDYHFIEPVTPNGDNVGAIWYADINDCELGLIKHNVFAIMKLIDENNFNMAIKHALDLREYLPILNDDGFEQLANILLLRLYDRFQGDSQMNKLFRWPLYLKKLAAYAYSLGESTKPDFKQKLELISFAYPAYFKDIKYNWAAINRTGDNINANNEHKNFNALLQRNFGGSLREKNKRLVIFRQHWSLINQLNDNPTSRYDNTTIEPDWATREAEYNSDQSARLISQQQQTTSGAKSNKFELTRFSDLTDAEFVAFLTNDYESLLDSRESQIYLIQNFKLIPLDDKLRDEIASELELRRLAHIKLNSLHLNTNTDPNGGGGSGSIPVARKSLARQVVDELISDVGLPIGPVSLDNLDASEVFSMFSRMANQFSKPYLSVENLRRSTTRFTEPSTSSSSSSSRFTSNEPNVLFSESDMQDERQARFETFKANYGRFRAWFIKEGWELNEAQAIQMLKFADMSWHEIKVNLFKLCCLADTNMETLSRLNTTIQYLGSQRQTFCVQMQPESPLTTGTSGSLKLDQQRQQQVLLERQTSDSIALELYYYYSVHFNKHHSNAADFARKFAIFRRNIDSIRKHSCKRDVTLFHSLYLKRGEVLNSMDVLDPRRIITDDLNLDRFEYFSLRSIRPHSQRVADFVVTSSPDVVVGGIDSAANQISYKRFAPLLNRPTTSDLNNPNEVIYHSIADKLLDSNENVNEYVLKYRRLQTPKIYEFIMQRYKYCMQIKGLDMDGSRKHCRALSGKLDDKANIGGLPMILTDDAWNRNQQDTHQPLLQDPRLTCDDLYLSGMGSWKSGLIEQDSLSPQLIVNAQCANRLVVT